MASCNKCSKKFGAEDCFLPCNTCNKSFHISCVNVSKTLFKSINNNKAIQWNCPTCLAPPLSPAASQRKSTSAAPQVEHSHEADDNVNCHICASHLEDADGFLCDICKCWSHWGCSDLEDLANTPSLRKIRCRILIVCAACDIKELRVNSAALKGLESKVNLLESKLDGILKSLPNNSSNVTEHASNQKSDHSMPNLADQIKSALKEQAQEDTLSRSLIISGLPERNDVQDMAIALDAIHSATSVPLLSADVEHLSRLGSTENPNGRPRLLRIVLKPTQKHMRNNIVSKATSLRKSTDPILKNVYVNADKSRAALKEEYETRCELRRRKATGEINLAIKNGKIVEKTPALTTSTGGPSVNC